MREYRLYYLDADGQLTKAHKIEAKNDKRALSLAREMKLSVNCVLWKHGHLLATLPASQ